MSFDWLTKQMDKADVEDSEISMPTGGDFVRGFAGEWMQRAMFKLYTPIEVNLDEHDIKYDHKVPTRSETGVFWYWHQVAGRREQAVAACDLVDWKSPTRVWRWEMDTATMLNYSGDDVTEQFGNSIAVDIELVGLLSTKRTEFQLLFLPSLVQAVGVLSGLMSEPVYNYDNLISDPESVTPEYCQRMVGEVEGRDTKYLEGELWQARSEIWAAYGEDNPKVWTTEEGGNTDTASEMLAIPFKMIRRPGVSYYSRISRVAAMRMPNDKEKAADRFPFGMNIVSQLWQTKEAAEAELGESSGDTPPTPAEWGNVTTAQFKVWVKEYIRDNYDGKTTEQVVAAVKKNKSLQGDLALTPDELIPWIEYVSEAA